jgi:Cu+-exporting ATPase
MNITAYMIAFDDQHQELIFPVDSQDLRAGDLLLLQAGTVVPADCKLLSGEVLIGGISRNPPLIVERGGLVENGTAKAYVIAADAAHAYTA